MKNCFVKQLSTNDCGVACLSMILKYYNIDATYETIKSKVRIDREGVSAFEIIKVSNEFGLKACGYKNIDISKIKTPFIAHVINDNNMQHFVVVFKVSSKNVLIADPSFGFKNVPKNDFLKKFTKVGITFNLKEELPIKTIFKEKRLILIIVFTTLLWALLSILYSYNISFIINSLKHSYSFIYFILLLFLFIGFLKELIFYIRNKIGFAFKLLVDKSLSIPTFKKVLLLPNKFYQAHPSGELISKINDLSYVKDIISKVVESLFVNVILMISILIILIILNPLLFIITILFSCIIYLLNKIFYKKYSYINYDLQVSTESLNEALISSFNNILVIKNYAKENHFIEKIINKYKIVLNNYNNLYNKYFKKVLLINTSYILYDFIMVMIFISFDISISNLIFIVMLSNMYLSSLYEVCDLYSSYADYKSSKNRINEMFSYESVNLDESNMALKNIKINNLNYSYGKKKVLSLDKLTISNNEWIMVIGKTGVGKSTLFKLITKQLSINKSILINNKPINEVLYKDIKNNITYVDQKSKLFSDSIKNNILIENGNYYLAAKTALVDKLIKDNNITYDYKIDSINENLSGGDIQKILIAQALCNAKKLLILDETTSQLDKKTERIILNNIKHNYKGLGLILISHNGTNKNMFDKVIELNK